MLRLACAGLIGPALLSLAGCASTTTPATTGETEPTQHSGFVDLSWDEASGRLFLHIDDFEEPFIYQVSLARGIGSNDIQTTSRSSPSTAR